MFEIGFKKMCSESMSRRHQSWRSPIRLQRRDPEIRVDASVKFGSKSKSIYKLKSGWLRNVDDIWIPSGHQPWIFCFGTYRCEQGKMLGATQLIGRCVSRSRIRAWTSTWPRCQFSLKNHELHLMNLLKKRKTQDSWGLQNPQVKLVFTCLLLPLVAGDLVIQPAAKDLLQTLRPSVQRRREVLAKSWQTQAWAVPSCNSFEKMIKRWSIGKNWDDFFFKFLNRFWFTLG